MANLTPTPKPRFARWCRTEIYNDAGRPFDYESFPHSVAPGGPADAIDDPRVRTITLQWATRLGKSFIGMCMLLYYADCDPCPMMLASESERSLKEKIMTRLYLMVYKNHRLRDKLLFASERDHKKDVMRFDDCRVIGAWAKSAGTLADENIRVGLANELDKKAWNGESTSIEGAPETLFDERFKDYQSTMKVFKESTPTIYKKSRVERGRLRGWNCTFQVPCPHCMQYQEIRFAAEKEDGTWDLSQPGKLCWDKAPGKERSDPDTARETAYYECISGKCDRITNFHRNWMMRRGVWIPEGCGVDGEKALAAAKRWTEDLLEDRKEVGTQTPWQGWGEADWITGKPARPGPNASHQLSSLCALSLTWGDCAAKWVEWRSKPTERKSYHQNWLGKTYRPLSAEFNWEALGRRAILPDIDRDLIPEWASVITMGVDRQKEHWVLVVCAWGGQRVHAVRYEDFDELSYIETLLNKRFRHVDGKGDGLTLVCSLIDNSYRPDSEVEDFCESMHEKGYSILPSKGSSVAMECDYKISILGENTSNPGTTQIRVDTMRTQEWIVHTLKDERLSLHSGSLLDHQDFLEQVLNDGSVLEIDRKTNNERESWKRLDTDIPNDVRDCVRYARVAQLIACEGQEAEIRRV